MKLSEAWLREWVNPELSTDELVAQLTMAGLEVDGIEAVAGRFDGVVVGEILSVESHPDADKLRICQVAGNPEGVCQVVCGAPNARAGIKVPFALVGAQLPGDFKIKKPSSVESNPSACSVLKPSWRRVMMTTACGSCPSMRQWGRTCKPICSCKTVLSRWTLRRTAAIA